MPPRGFAPVLSRNASVTIVVIEIAAPATKAAELLRQLSRSCAQQCPVAGQAA